MKIKPVLVQPRRIQTCKKLEDYSQRRGGKPLATIITDMLELVASGELRFSNGTQFFD